MKKSINQLNIEHAINSALSSLTLSVSVALCHKDALDNGSIPLDSDSFVCSTATFTFDLYYADRRVAGFESLDSLCTFTSALLTEFSTLDSSLISVRGGVA